jgi:hypothetical protein
MTKTFWIVTTAVIAACFSGATANAGIIYNANNEFKNYMLSSPSEESTFGNFSTGTSANVAPNGDPVFGDFTPFGTGNKNTAILGSPSLKGWNFASFFQIPFVGVNTSSSAVTGVNTLTSIAPSEIIMHGDTNLNAVLRFTATAAGDYAIRGNWHSLDVNPTYNYVLRNSSILFSSFADDSTFNLTTTLQVGDTIDFVNNVFGDLGADSTGLFAELEFNPVAAVPEPTTMTLLGLGGVCVVGFARRKRKTSVAV